MAVYLSNHVLSRWSDTRTWDEAQQLYTAGGVSDIDITGDVVHATVFTGQRPLYTRFRILSDGTVMSDCPCLQNQRLHTVCAHVVAAGLAVAALTEDPPLERRRRIEARIRAAATGERSPGPWRAGAARAGATPASLRIRVPETWIQDLKDGPIRITCRILIDGHKHAPDRIDPDRNLAFPEPDVHLLYVLEDMAASDFCPACLDLSPRRFGELLAEMSGTPLWIAGAAVPLHVSADKALSILTLTQDPETGRLFLRHRSEPGGRVVLNTDRGAWILAEEVICPLEALLPPEWTPVLHQPVEIPRARFFHFLSHGIPQLESLCILENDVAVNTWTVSTGVPDFEVQIDGASEHMQIILLAVYDRTYYDTATAPVDTDRAPVEGDPHRYTARNAAGEAQARRQFLEHFDPEAIAHGAVTLHSQQAIVHTLAETVPRFREAGWRVQFGRAFTGLTQTALWIRPCIVITRDATGRYRLDMTFRDEHDNPVGADTVEQALKSGQAVIPAAGRTLLLNAPALQALQTALAECLDYRNSVAYVNRIHASFIAALAEKYAHSRITAPEDWLAHVQQQHRIDIDPVAIPAPLNRQLRPYQTAGVNWLGFLDQSGYCGILADEMGLGKTVQALAWLQARYDAASHHPTPAQPAIVICPTSLIHNWAREAGRFTPSLSCAVISGTGRHRQWADIATHALIITSYALLRRDITYYQDLHFSAVVLDEAQHIKNRSTQNAVAAKRLRAERRLVLTGTPIENSVNDLWSIMDFLMPGYLGTHTSFKIRFEQPITGGNAHATRALQQLRMKMEPFMLRRLKKTVEADLPEKVVRIASCPMHPAQKRIYRRLLSQYQDQLAQLVDKQGFDRSRFSVFSALLRLRQCCCHPALLKNMAAAQEAESGKTDLFFELLDEVIDGGHRVLVFSQFVQMLHILRSALTARSIPFAYLDGGTRDRMAQVDRFNEDPAVPVFLVSLKAGGSGLNLTGADVVIHYDPWWNPAVEDQATDRVHRIGQERTVYSIKLVTEDSIEQKVIDLQQRKRAVINATLGDTAVFEQTLTWEDVQELLRPGDPPAST